MNAEGGEQKRVWRVPTGYGQFGGFSRDGKSALSFNRYNLYVHDLSTKHIHHVLVWSTGWGTYVASPSFSPDGKQIVCEVGDGNQNASNSQVLLLRTGGTYSFFGKAKPQELHPIGPDIPSTNLWSAPCWSSDGRKVTVVGGPQYSFNSLYSKTSTDPNSQIWTMSVDGTGTHQVTRTSAWNKAPAWSPDGKTLVFVRSFKTSDSDLGVYSSNLVSVDVSSGVEKQLTTLPERFDDLGPDNLPPTLSKPLFSPNGTRIAFEESANNTESKGIYRIDADGNNGKRLNDGNLVQWVP